MYLQSIKLEDYRKFEDAEVEFPDGVVGIIGNNGVGKSSLFEAIAWSLYGNDVARTGRKEIKRTDADPAKVCRVTLNFEFQGDNYRVVRELRGKEGDVGKASMFINNQVAARGVTAVNELVEKTLKMDWKSFLTSFFARQKELNALTDYQPHKRKEVLSRMLGIEEIEASIQSLRADKRDLETKLETARSFLKDKLELEQQKLQKEKVLGELKVKKENLELDLKVFQVKLKAFTSELDFLKEISEKFKQLIQITNLKKQESQWVEEQINKKIKEKKRIEMLIPEREQLKPEVAKYEKIKTDLNAYDQMKLKAQQKQHYQEQITKLNESIQKDQQRIQALDKEITWKAEFEMKIDCSIKQLESLEKNREQHQKDFSEIQAKERSNLDQTKKLKQQLAKIEELGEDSTCELCLRPLKGDYQSIKEHVTEELHKLEQELKEIWNEKNKVSALLNEVKTNLAKVKAQKEKAELSLRDLVKSQGEYENLQKGLKEKEQQHTQFSTQLKDLGEVDYDPQKHMQLKSKLELIEKSKEKFIEMNQKLKELPAVETEIEELKKRNEIIKAETDRLESELEQLRFDEPAYKQKSLQLEDMRQKFFDLQLGVKDLIDHERLILQEKEALEQQIQQNQTLEKEIKTLEQERFYLEKLDLILADFKLHLIGRIRPALARIARQLLAEMSEGKYNDLELDENYEIFIYDNGQKFSLERFSGGEKDLANLCLRLAISWMISEASGSEFSFIILDEVFGSQDIARKENILKALNSLKSRFRQIFLITHIEDIKDSLDNLITVTEI